VRGWGEGLGAPAGWGGGRGRRRVRWGAVGGGGRPAQQPGCRWPPAAAACSVGWAASCACGRASGQPGSRQRARAPPSYPPATPHSPTTPPRKHRKKAPARLYTTTPSTSPRPSSPAAASAPASTTSWRWEALGGVGACRGLAGGAWQPWARALRWRWVLG
jgi:hypothetical protein